MAYTLVQGAHDDSDFARRAQLMLFSGLASMDGWNTGFEPWAPDVSAANAKMFAALATERSRLATFLFTAYNRQSVSGVPVVRSLVVDYDSDVAAYAIVDQFLLGDGLMVAPTPINATGRNVTFPVGGGDWVDYWGKSKSTYAAGKTYLLAASDLDVLVFQQKGKAIPLVAPPAYFQTPATTTDNAADGNTSGNYGDAIRTSNGIENGETVLVLRVHADGQDSQSFVYDDDGITTKESVLGEVFMLNVTTSYHTSADQPQVQHHRHARSSDQAGKAVASLQAPRVLKLHAAVQRAAWVPVWKWLRFEVVTVQGTGINTRTNVPTVECGGIPMRHAGDQSPSGWHMQADGSAAVKTMIVHVPFEATLGFAVSCSVSL